MTLKQSFTFWSFAPPGTDPAALFRGAAEIGYAGVELLPPEYWGLAKDVGLTITAIGGHDAIESGLNRRDNHPRIIREVEANLQLAERWGIPSLIVFSGNRDGLDDTDGAAAAAEGLQKLAPLAKAAGVTLLLELLNSRVDHPDYQCDHTAWGVGVIERVASPKVKLLYDVYHMQIMEGDLIRTVREYHPHIGHYHTAGNPGRQDLDEAQEIYYPAVFKAIAATGFGGYVAHEFIPKGEPVAALKAAFELCHSSLKESL